MHEGDEAHAMPAGARRIDMGLEVHQHSLPSRWLTECTCRCGRRSAWRTYMVLTSSASAMQAGALTGTVGVSFPACCGFSIVGSAGPRRAVHRGETVWPSAR